MDEVDERRIPRPRGSPWVRGTMVACGAVLVWVVVAAANIRWGSHDQVGQEPATLWIVPLVFALYGLAWGAPWPTAGLTWLGVEAAIIATGFLAAPATGWGPLFWYATASGFVAAFAAFVGAWIRGAGARMDRFSGPPPR